MTVLVMILNKRAFCGKQDIENLHGPLCVCVFIYVCVSV